jgi:hypothetical protein
MKRILVFIGLYVGAILIVILILFFLTKPKIFIETPLSFAECMKAGNVVQESYPRRCITKEGKTFIENIGNVLEKANLISVSSPTPNAQIKSPLTISGQARGGWFFEGSFPIRIVDAFGNILAHGSAQAKGDWQTSAFVPFSATLTFEKSTATEGELILEKDNPSGLPQNNDALHIPVSF